MENECHIDIELLQGYLDSLGRDVVQQMLDLYAQQAEVYLSDIQTTLEQQDESAWQDKCHKMKGAAGSSGLTDVHALLTKIEKSELSWSQRQNKFDQLQRLNKEALTTFRAWLSKV